MFELIIRNADQSVYWREYFNSLDEAQIWLDTEKTRPYWKQDFTTEIIDNSPPPKTSTELQQEANDIWVNERSIKCDNDIAALLLPMQDTTHLMLSIYNMYIALNISGSQTQEDIDEAKGNLQSALLLMEQVQAIRNQRDLDIQEYLTSHPAE